MHLADVSHACFHCNRRNPVAQWAEKEIETAKQKSSILQTSNLRKMNVNNLTNAESSNSNPYADIFYDYISRSLEDSLEKIKDTGYMIPDDLLMQAWHDLDYGLQKLSGWESTSKLLLELSPKMEQAKFWNEWIEYLERGVKCSKSSGDYITEIEIRTHLGHLHFLRSEFDLAKEWLSSSLKLIREGEVPSDLHAKVLNRLGFVAYRQKDSITAKNLAQQTLSLSGVGLFEKANCYYILGDLAFEERNFSEAESSLRSSLGFWRKSHNKRKIAWGLRNLAPVLCEQGKIDEAIEYLHEAIAILDRLQDVFNLAVTRMNLGIVYIHKGLPQNAIGIFVQVEPVFLETKSNLLLAKLYHNQGMAFRNACEWDSAQTAYQHSIDLWMCLKDKWSEINAMDGLGLVYMEQGLHEISCRQFRMALAELSHLEYHSSHDFLYKEITAHLQMAQALYKPEVESSDSSSNAHTMLE